MLAAARVDLDARQLRWAGFTLLSAASAAAVVGVDGPACPLRSLTGIPCPFCGMTRGVASTMRGDVGHALALNPGSVALVAATLILLVLGRRARDVSFPTWTVMGVVAAMWAFELVKFATGRPL